MNILYHGDRMQISGMLFTLFDTLTRPVAGGGAEAVPVRCGGADCKLDYAVLDIGQWGLKKEDLRKIAGFLLMLADGRRDESLLHGDTPVAVLSRLILQCYHCKDSGVPAPEHTEHAGRDEFRRCSGYAMDNIQPVCDVEYIRPMQSNVKAC